MKDEIKKALAEVSAPYRLIDGAVVNAGYTLVQYMNIYGEVVANEEDAHLIANAPTWLQWQNDRIEQLEEALEELRSSVCGIDNIVNVAVGYGELLDYGLLSSELNRIANEASQALGKDD